MLEPGAHWEFVLAAYAAVLIIMAALVVVSVAQARRARRDLEGLEARRREGE
ncbi:MAG: heme exporter protein CcmD [Rubrimonas sp.]